MAHSADITSKVPCCSLKTWRSVHLNHQSHRRRSCSPTRLHCGPHRPVLVPNTHIQQSWGNTTNRHIILKNGHVYQVKFYFGNVSQFTWGVRLMLRWVVCSGNQGQGEDLRLVRMLSLRCDHGAQLGQWQRSFGHQLITHIWIIISRVEGEKSSNHLFKYAKPPIINMQTG